MRISRSLTIKQMAIVSAVALVTICLFIVIQLFHFVQQRRTDYAQQMESIAHTVRQPLSQAVLRADIPQAKSILNSLKPAGILVRADVVLPNAFQVLHTDFDNEQPVPQLIARVFDLPVQITVPLYSLESAASPKPMAWLVLQADSWRVYQFILSTISTMVTTCVLLALILSVAISWCINRLIVHPLRDIACELQTLSSLELTGHQLPLPVLHQDDEIGLLIRNYNRNQQMQAALYDMQNRSDGRHPVTHLPGRKLMLAFLEHSLQTGVVCVMLLRIETLLAFGGVLTDEQRNALMLMLLERMRAALTDTTIIGQLTDSDFVLLARTNGTPPSAMQQARSLLSCLTQPVSLQQMSLRPVLSVGITLCDRGGFPGAGQLLEQASSAMQSARHQGKNQILFFHSQHNEQAEHYLQQQHALLRALEEGSATLFLQPQVNMRTGTLVAAQASLRWLQGAGSRELPVSREEDDNGEMPERWMLEEACRILAGWQKRGLSLPLSVTVSALWLYHPHRLAALQALMERHRIIKNQLVLTLTKIAEFSNSEQIASLLMSLTRMGIVVALDDTVAGCASFLLAQITPSASQLMPGGHIIAGLPMNNAAAKVVSTLAAVTGLNVVADGVHSNSQRDWLLAHNITLGQGDLYDAPLNLYEFEKWLTGLSGRVTEN